MTVSSDGPADLNPWDDYVPDWAPSEFESWEYEMFRPRLTRELQRQIAAPQNLVRLRLYLYSNIDGHANQGKVELFWIKFPALLDQALAEGRVIRLPQDEAWLTFPDTLDDARLLYPTKSKLYTRWKELTGTAGAHLETLVRQALIAAHYTVGPKATTFHWNGESIELDAFTLGPLRLAIEAKNKFSEVYYSPAVSGYVTDDLEQIERMFAFSSSNNMIPVLVASLVDRTFYSFQDPYQRLHCCLKFQLFPDKAKWRQLCHDIREQLLVGNVQPWADPPPWMQRWFDSIPSYYQRRYGSPPHAV
jgi:hypothetical protein